MIETTTEATFKPGDSVIVHRGDDARRDFQSYDIVAKIKRNGNIRTRDGREFGPDGRSLCWDLGEGARGSRARLVKVEGDDLAMIDQWHRDVKLVRQFGLRMNDYWLPFSPDDLRRIADLIAEIEGKSKEATHP